MIIYVITPYRPFPVAGVTQILASAKVTESGIGEPTWTLAKSNVLQVGQNRDNENSL